MTLTKYENKIPAGYVLEITSYENDFDFYNTKRLTGLEETELQWHIKFLEFVVEAQKVDSDRSIAEVMEELYEGNPDKYKELKEYIPARYSDYAECFQAIFPQLEYTLLGYTGRGSPGSRQFLVSIVYYLHNDLSIQKYC
jgi:hypothetical protein